MTKENKDRRKQSLTLYLAATATIIVLLFAALQIIGYSGHHIGGPGTVFAKTYEIQEELQPYIRLNVYKTQIHDSTYDGIGWVLWKNSAGEAPIKSLQNIRLIMYATVKQQIEETPSWYEIHYVAHTGDFTLPENIIGHSQEMTIPYIGVDNPLCDFMLSINYRQQLP